jgi:hypothetical protein
VCEYTIYPMGAARSRWQPRGHGRKNRLWHR